MLMKLHLTATECHLPNRISGSPLTPAGQAGTRFTYPGGMEV